MKYGGTATLFHCLSQKGLSLGLLYQVLKEQCSAKGSSCHHYQKDLRQKFIGYFQTLMNLREVC